MKLSQAPQPVILFQGDGSGHRLEYCAHIIREAQRRRTPIDFVIPTPVAEGREWQVHILPLQDYEGLRIIFWDSGVESLLNSINTPTTIILPDADALIARLVSASLKGAVSARPKYWRARFLVMRPVPVDGSVFSRLRWCAKVASVTALSRIFGMTAFVLSLPGSKLGKAWRLAGGTPIADPVFIKSATPRALLRESAGLAQNVVLTCILGEISERKYAIEAIQAVEGNPGVSLALIGRHSANVQQAARLVDNVISIDDYVDPATQDDWLNAADVILGLNRHTGPSGLVAKALATGRPLVAGGNRYICSHLSTAPNVHVLRHVNAEQIARTVTMLSQSHHFAQSLFVDTTRDFGAHMLGGVPQ